MTLIGSAALLWHAARKGILEPLSENSMDADPVTDSEELAWMCYDAVIGSEFEQEHGWHINLMPASVLKEMPSDWHERSVTAIYGKMEVTVPAVPDLLHPKLKRNEPRDRRHADWARDHGLI
jgi:hypothetical protein